MQVNCFSENILEKLIQKNDKESDIIFHVTSDKKTDTFNWKISNHRYKLYENGNKYISMNVDIKKNNKLNTQYEFRIILSITENSYIFYIPSLSEHLTFSFDNKLKKIIYEYDNKLTKIELSSKYLYDYGFDTVQYAITYLNSLKN
jgi:hypothetical protein